MKSEAPARKASMAVSRSAKCGDQDHLAGKSLVAQFLEPRHAAFSRQRNVQDDAVERDGGAQQFGAFLGAARFHHEMTAGHQRLHQEIAHPLLVVDDWGRPERPPVGGFVGS